MLFMLMQGWRPSDWPQISLQMTCGSKALEVISLLRKIYKLRDVLMALIQEQAFQSQMKY